MQCCTDDGKDFGILESICHWVTQCWIRKVAKTYMHTAYCMHTVVFFIKEKVFSAFVMLK
jgi:hypothetical protein